ncbi:uncharacterized protein DUF3617 [Mesorhizobium sp. J18]|uniref:DUF3617 domain-containing protein n=1 Tax=Mesorhizobium sp. J18 TaxID=935263 RepID=UPI00119AF53B|nr:DUF3617 family protein [Mesorhizobium sp. J18]TWG92108.1 uncharacterized protein DUF3617 [Mesorhizobium sp. J18]
MKPVASLIAVGAVVGIALSSLPAATHDLPKNIPARKPGLWEMRTTGTVGSNQAKAIKKYCLDASSDRALYELEILRKQLQVIYSDISCQAPKVSMSGNVMTGEMACRTNSPDDDETAGMDFRWTTTFRSDSEVVNEEHSLPRGVMFHTENNTITEQRWVSECPADLNPGGIVDLGFTYNSDAWPNENIPPDTIQDALKRLEKSMQEGIEINKRLGPM